MDEPGPFDSLLAAGAVGIVVLLFAWPFMLLGHWLKGRP